MSLPAASYGSPSHISTHADSGDKVSTSIWYQATPYGMRLASSSRSPPTEPAMSYKWLNNASDRRLIDSSSYKQVNYATSSNFPQVLCIAISRQNAPAGIINFFYEVRS